MKTAIVFLTKTPHANTIKFAKEIQEKTPFEVIIIADDYEYNHQKKTTMGMGSDVPITIQIGDALCVSKGYHHSNINGATHIKKDPIAMDKFLYLLCEEWNFDFVWVFEDDVFIPSVDTIINLHRNYCQYDLVTPNNFLKQDTLPDWHWKHIFSKIEPPYYYSMVCAMGLSKAMLDCIKKYVAENGELFYIEAMFNTLAMQNGLEVMDAFELKSIVWQGEWGIDEFLLLPNNVFHPRKDIENHPTLRKQIEGYSAMSEYVPTNKLPPFINELL
jgi:hypothetical protein